MLRRVDVLLIEIHLSGRLGASAVAFQVFYELIFERHGFKFAYLRANKGRHDDQNVERNLMTFGARHHICCYEMALVRPQLVAEGVSLNSR